MFARSLDRCLNIICNIENCEGCSGNIEDYLTCKPGYGRASRFSKGCAASGMICLELIPTEIKCQACKVENCSECQMDLGVCGACDSGYELLNAGLVCEPSHEL